MIKSNELRIGNYIYSEEEKKDIKVNGINNINASYGNNNFHNLRDFKGIEITEQWLLDFGLIKSNYNKNRYDIPNKYFHVVKQKDRWVFRGMGMSVAYCDHVHTFQNIIHALTGEELTLKQ